MNSCLLGRAARSEHVVQPRGIRIVITCIMLFTSCVHTGQSRAVPSRSSLILIRKCDSIPGSVVRFIWGTWRLYFNGLIRTSSQTSDHVIIGRPQTKKLTIAMISATRPILRKHWLRNARTAATSDNAVPIIQAASVILYTDLLGPFAYR